ncbi:MAG: SRPBCC domain-containing protein [Candidatus Angelobacter sp.]
MKIEDLTLDVEQQIDIKAAPEKVFAAMLERFGKGNTSPSGESLQLNLEPKPGGRWYRDRGNGIGHLWGFVQVIKPPSLLELSGPMFMSYPAHNHVEIKVEKTATGSHVTLRHRALGMIDPEHRKGVGQGWGHMLAGLKKDAE